MKFIIPFFRDFLSGTLYIVVAFLSFIGIVTCIVYILRITIKQRKEQQEYEKMYTGVHLLPESEDTGLYVSSNTDTVISTAQIDYIGDVSATNMAKSIISDDVDTKKEGNDDSSIEILK